MRTATPAATWVVTRDRGPDATAGSISTPSFMGPGWSTTTSGRHARSRSSVRPYRALKAASDGAPAPWTRSRWTRSAITAAASSSAAATSVVTVSRRSAGRARAQASKPRSSAAGP